MYQQRWKEKAECATDTDGNLAGVSDTLFLTLFLEPLG